MQTQDNKIKSHGVAKLNEDYLFKGINPNDAYKKAINQTRNDSTQTYGLKKAMLAAINYHFAIHAPQVTDKDLDTHKKEYDHAIQLLLDPDSRYQQLIHEYMQIEELAHEHAKELMEAELITLMADNNMLKHTSRIKYLTNLIENWDDHKHAVFSEFLVKMKKHLTTENYSIWIKAADAVLETPFYENHISYIDASYNAHQQSRVALQEGSETEAHLFITLKAAIDYNRAKFSPDTKDMDLDLREYKLEYENIRDSLLLNKNLI